MAVVLVSLSATRTRQVFRKPTDLVREFSPWPRALVMFSILDGAITLKALNNTEELIISMVLDFRFAYRMVDLNASLTQDTANDWRAVAYLEMINSVRGTPVGTNTRYPIALQDTTIRDSSDDELWVAAGVPERLPHTIIQATRPAIAPTVNFNAVNITAAAAAAGTVNFYASFLEYDIEQVENLPIHYPVSVLSR